MTTQKRETASLRVQVTQKTALLYSLSFIVITKAIYDTSNHLTNNFDKQNLTFIGFSKKKKNPH